MNNQTITLHIEAKLTADPNRAQNVLHFKFEDTSVNVVLEDKKVGSVCGIVGGGLELTDEASRCTWTMYAPAIWYAFQEALKEIA